MFIKIEHYQQEIRKIMKSIIPPGSKVLEVGCGEGVLLRDISVSIGIGLDIVKSKIETARKQVMDGENIQFIVEDIEQTPAPDIEDTFNYIILSDLVQELSDVQDVFGKLDKFTDSSSRVVINFPSNVWRPILKLASLLSFRKKDKKFNWLSMDDVSNLLYIAGFEPITKQRHVLVPIYIPLLSHLINKYIAQLPILNHLCLVNVLVARKVGNPRDEYPSKPTVSIVVPTMNEKGNIEDAFLRTPQMGSWTELVFVDGNSTDGTLEEIDRCKKIYSEKWDRVKVVLQDGKGKGQAVRQGFDVCTGDMYMILDSDLTMPPEELPKYYEALRENKGELINGCRLVYEMEGEAMRFLNMIANWLFALIFTWLLRQPVKDTLCGTKVLWKNDYEKIASNRHFLGELDPFGDFDLLFGASKLNLKIVDLPIRYQDRSYGDIKINRWSHGLLLLKMTLVALKKLRLV